MITMVTARSGLFFPSPRWRLGALLGLALAGASAGAADWPQYRGTDQTGRSAEPAVIGWPAAGPRVVWKVPTPNGFSSFAVSGQRAFTLVARDGREACVALDTATGKELWAALLGAAKYPGGGDDGAPGNRGGDGPRSTPAVSDGSVYVLDHHLVLYALSAADGRMLWTHDLMKEYAGRNISWLNAAAPVVDGDRVFVAGGGPGESLLAFHKTTGQLAWKGQDEIITHATPLVATLHGERQVIYFMKSGLVAVAAKDGRLLWRFPFPFSVSSAIMPVLDGNLIYCSAGYGVGSAVCRVTRDGAGFKAAEVWRIEGDKQVANHWSTPVCKDGYLYGMFSFKKYGTGPLKCVELATGKICWEQPGFGPGNVILVGDRLAALADDGRVVIVQASPKAYEEICRCKAVDGKCWSTPAFSDGRLYVRSTKEAACLAAVTP